MAFLHSCEVGVHGKLRSSNCLIDGRFVLKLSNFGLRTLTTPSEVVRDSVYYHSKLEREGHFRQPSENNKIVKNIFPVTRTFCENLVLTYNR